MNSILRITGILLVTTNIAIAQHGHEHRQESRYRDGLENWDRIEFRFGGRSHVERLADALWHNVNAVCWDAYSNYRHERNWDVTYREMRQMLDDAEHIQELVREQEYHRTHHEDDHIASDLHDMDDLFHHLEDDVRNWRARHTHIYHRDHDDHYHPIGRDPYRHHGSLRTRMRRLESTLHHMMEDYGVLRTVDCLRRVQLSENLGDKDRKAKKKTATVERINAAHNVVWRKMTGPQQDYNDWRENFR